MVRPKVKFRVYITNANPISAASSHVVMAEEWSVDEDDVLEFTVDNDKVLPKTVAIYANGFWGAVVEEA